MSMRISSAELEQVAAVAPEPGSVVVDRTFEVPTGLYAVTVGAYLSFMGLMALTFHSSQLILPMVVITFFIIAAFGVLAVWANMKPDTKSQSLGWYDFKRKGIQTLSGPLDAGSAAAQVLVLPVLIVFWGLAIAIIAATV